MESITPEILHEVRFERARGGYRAEDVDDFLVRVADGVAALRAQLCELEGTSPENHARQLLDAARRVADDLLIETRARAEVVAFEQRQRLVVATSELVRMSAACGQALEVVEAVRGELRLAHDALRAYLGHLEASVERRPAPGGEAASQAAEAPDVADVAHVAEVAHALEAGGRLE